jgi:hypothetical protein
LAAERSLPARNAWCSVEPNGRFASDGITNAAATLTFVNQLDAAGAEEVSIDPGSLPCIRSGSQVLPARGGEATRMLIRLPGDDRARQRVMDLLQPEQVRRQKMSLTVRITLTDWEGAHRAWVCDRYTKIVSMHWGNEGATY